ncbi:hypothetical protein DRN34_03735 [Thermococci archaeon]|nr:MAG: hypothetical protein DRN34_03735 [Thermococci archaeon]
MSEEQHLRLSNEIVAHMVAIGVDVYVSLNFVASNWYNIKHLIPFVYYSGKGNIRIDPVALLEHMKNEQISFYNVEGECHLTQQSI